MFIELALECDTIPWRVNKNKTNKIRMNLFMRSDFTDLFIRLFIFYPYENYLHQLYFITYS
ncbi:hypothetical protein DMB44_02760 [Thermoplasma sp. Kam2015]|nr:hypothetical protein DMB44_02760 [Thermoplasma sp. Kam2015]